MSALDSSEAHVFRSDHGTHVLVVDGSRIYDVPDGGAQDLAEFSDDLSRSLPDRTARYIDGTPLDPPRLHSLSLNVAQACNMACSYCYADEGAFGGSARLMNDEIAREAARCLISGAEPGAEVLLGFMGGEPLLNRQVVHSVTRFATEYASMHGRSVRFSITTNGTLINSDDVELFSMFPFSVQLSLDGNRGVNDPIRLMRDRTSSYDRVLAALKLFQKHGRPRRLSARATVTPRTGELLPILDHLIGLGFDDVGFAPVVVAPSASQEFDEGQFTDFLERMIRCGRKALTEIAAGRDYPFANFETAMQEIHRGSHRPYPCGAGAAYLSANADGNLFACHRLIDDKRFAMGDVATGPDRAAQARHLRLAHVDQQTPCHGCWARYLCGGGCYHEVTRRGRLGCNYIRGWLDFCLGAYVELTVARPLEHIPQGGPHGLGPEAV